jgi:hypothetical protein
MSKKKKSFSSSLSRFILVIGAVTMILGIATKEDTRDNISHGQIVIFLVIVVIAAAIDSVWVKLILALVGLSFFILGSVHYNLGNFKTIAIPVLQLLIVLFGIFVIVGGMRRK